MDLAFFGGIFLFFVGLVLAHVVVAATRTAVRKHQPMKTWQRVMLWTSVGLVVAGAMMTGLGYFLGR